MWLNLVLNDLLKILSIGFVQYMSSQYLMGTSLSQDVNQFDFNNPVEAYTRYETSDDSNALDQSSVGSLHEEVRMDIS